MDSIGWWDYRGWWWKVLERTHDELGGIDFGPSSSSSPLLSAPLSLRRSNRRRKPTVDDYSGECPRLSKGCPLKEEEDVS